MKLRLVSLASASALLGITLPTLAQEVASFATTAEVKLLSDVRSRGVSDSANRPGAKVSVQIAHQSGLVGLAEFVTVSKKQFLKGNGAGITLGAGYRFGDPDGWRYGVGLAAELFPGAKFDAPHGIDLVALATGGAPDTNYKRGKFDSTFALAEIGYGPFEARLANVVSKNFRGINTGSVCGTLLNAAATTGDPTPAIDCYARGDNSSRGTWLLDLGYKYDINPTTTLNLHGGYQRVANFKEANLTDYSVGITHKRWDFLWTAEFISSRTRLANLYKVDVGGGKTRVVDNDKIVLSVSRSF